MTDTYCLSRLATIAFLAITISDSFKPRPVIVAVLPLSCTDSILMTNTLSESVSLVQKQGSR
jgi:hypothetical protein